ncbi:MAG: hypothetical protein HYZ00_02160 [Candidatus Hydrogenedentes bacterium]|nr:hypothetical protein [Candidatus Hydrogenedentota bacterium]
MLHTADLGRRFKSFFPDSTEIWGCRVPGRVNLIGEHLDYNGLPVLPVALERALFCVFAKAAGGTVSLANANSMYRADAFENVAEIAPSPQAHWSNYCKAALIGLNRALRVSTFPGMQLLVSGNLPSGAGLSSSSALVVACALAYLQVLGVRLGKDVSRVALAELLAGAEHYVGTRGGGMDQAVILNARAGHALKIDFFPLRLEHAPLPRGCSLYVCDSGMRVEKSGDSLHRYNAGPALCRVLTALVEKQTQEEIDEGFRLARLGELCHGLLCLTYREAEELCLRSVPEARWSVKVIAVRLGMTPDEVRRRYLGDMPEPAQGFPLQARLRHVLTEFRRVELARDALLAGDTGTLGELMNASHESCARDYEISVPALDDLAGAARDAGALGARLTGAGFGGATVNLVPDAREGQFHEHMARYYAERRMNAAQCMFKTLGGGGADYFGVLST